MSNVLSLSGTLRGFSPTRSPFVQAAVLSAVVFVISWHFTPDDFYGFSNTRKDQIFSSVFTFISIVLGASVSVWALLKSRATRYIERLHENTNFKLFVAQFEARLLICLLAIAATFAMYIYGSDFAFRPGHRTYICFGWIFLTTYSQMSIYDSLRLARHMLG